jgi:glycosyltransferase involved in cell wall biosynthesis
MGKKRRVLVVSHSCANPVNQQVYRELKAQTGWEFTILLPAVWKDEFGNRLLSSALPSFDVELAAAPVWPNGSIILHAYWLNLRRLLQSRKFDVIYMNHEPYAVATAQVCWAALCSTNTPFGFYSCQNLEKNYPPPFCWMERQVYRSSAFAFPITDAVAQVLRRKGFQGALAVCPLPFDPNLFRKHSETERLETIPRKNGEIVIGYVGRMVEEKGLGTLVEALARLPRSGWKLVVIGAGPFETTFDQMVRERGLGEQVHRLGYMAHTVTPRFLGALDILVLPSETRPNWKEQFGRVIVEALACGVPVIGSNSGEIPTLINTSGGGRIFPESNPDALAQLLRQMIRDQHLRKSYADAGCSWAVKNVSLSAVAASMACTIEGVLAREDSTPNALTSSSWAR